VSRKTGRGRKEDRPEELAIPMLSSFLPEVDLGKVCIGRKESYGVRPRGIFKGAGG